MEQNVMQSAPKTRNGAFDDIDAAATLINLGTDALKGIGAMMEPEYLNEDGQMNLAHRSDASAVFRFFGEVLKEPLQTITNAAFRLEQETKRAES